MGRIFPLTTTPAISDAARRWLDGERWEVARPRRASTVMLVRDAESTVEVFMLRRVSQMAFAPSTMVFPGGGVDDRDGDDGLPWAGPSPTQWGARLGCSPADAQLFVAAAIREVFEECGVLLAGPSADGPLARVEAERWRGVRDALIAREVSLGEVLRDEGLVLRSDLVVAKAHWVTPVFEPRRFDTWFFAAHMPRGQTADGDTSEADHAAWVTPRELLSAYAAGSASMLPPTVMWVEEIHQTGSARDFVAHAEHLPLIIPEVVDSELGPAMEVVER
ncbi:NUDIX hydrolase [Humibacillus xanthopallidus]|uniref:NUDIX hydrolase n=1 Tax=Humibacillus xanthopallidus TaxID=412689 RepID=UPI00384D7E23